MAVLILVVVEDGLRVLVLLWNSRSIWSLNPCCCGRWSQRCSNRAMCPGSWTVLILVVVEDGLRASLFVLLKLKMELS